ncbi:protein phosphatase 2C [Bacillus sp. SIMBA_069]
MLNKLKKFMLVAAAAVMLSAGFATVAPNEAHAAHWADKQMRWAFNEGIITADLRDNLATRQDAWLMLFRTWAPYESSIQGTGYGSARNYVIREEISDGLRGTNWVTRDEMMGMIYQAFGVGRAWIPEYGFSLSRKWAIRNGIYDGSRGNDFATRAEVVAMLYNANARYN